VFSSIVLAVYTVFHLAFVLYFSSKVYEGALPVLEGWREKGIRSSEKI